MPSFSGLIYVTAVIMALFGSYILMEEVISQKVSIISQRAVRYFIFPLFIIFVLSYPFQYSPGVILDQRGAIIAIVTLFSGWRTGLLTTITASFWRLHLGGVGTSAGVVGILCEFLAVIWMIHILGEKNTNFSQSLKLSTLFLLGTLVGLCESLSLLLIPPPSYGLHIFSQTGVGLFLVQLTSTVFMGGLLGIQEHRKRIFQDYQNTQSELESSRTLLETLISHIPGNLYSVSQSPNGLVKFEYVSSGCRELLELEPEQILTDPHLCLELIHPDDRPGYNTAVNQSAQTLKPFSHQWRLITPSGKIKWVQGSSRPQLRPPGDIVWHGVILDISDQKKAEIALQQSEERYRHITATIPGILCDYVLEPEQKFLYLSPRCLDILEISPQVLLQDIQQFWKLVHPEDLQTLKTLQIEANHHQTQLIAEFRLIPPSGRLLWLQLSALPGKSPEPTSVIIWSGFMLDITTQKQAQLLLLSQETFLRTIYEGVELGIFVVEALPNQDFRILSINPCCQRTVGLPLEKIIGKTLLELDLPNMERVRKKYCECIELGKPLAYEETVEINGETSWWYTTLTPLRNQENQIDRIIGTSLNIKEVKITQNHLKRLQERMTLVLKGSDDGWWDWDLEQEDYYYSPRWWEMLGYIQENLDLNPSLWRELIHPEDREFVDQTLSQTLETDRESYQVEFRLRHQQGYYVPVRSRGYIQRDQNQVPIRISGADSDLTSWKQKEFQLQNALNALQQLNQQLELRVEERAQALMEREQRYRALMEGASDAIILTDLEGHILEANRKAIEILGYSEKELLSLHLSQFYPPEETDQSLPLICDIAQQKNMRCKDGKFVRVEITRSVVNWGGEQIVFSIYRDITERQLIEDALRKSQENLRLITDSLPICISYIDCHQSYHFVNHTYQVWFHKTPEQILGKQVRELLDERAYQVFLQKFNQVIEGKSVTYENWLFLPQENPRQVYVTLLPDYGGTQQVQGCFVMTIDITELKTAELALRESEQRFRYLADHAPVLIWMSGLDQLCFYFNQPWLDFTGNTLEQENGNGWCKGVHPDDFQHCIQTYTQAFDQRQSFEMAYRLKRFDGEYRWILDHGVPRYSADGKFLGYIGSCLDITERKRAEEALAVSEERFRRYFEQSLIGMAITSPEEKWLDVNQRLCEILGYSYEELLQMTWTEITYPEDLFSDLKNFNKVLAGAIDGYTMDKRFIRKNKEIIDASISVRCLRRADGKVDFFVAMIQDISDRKKAEYLLKETNEQLAQSNAELARATRLKDEFLANMSHELRTPLNAILGMCEGLQDEVFGTLNQRQIQALKTIERSGNHLLELINDILDLAKVESGKLELQLAPVAIHYLCESSLTFIRQQCLKKGLQLSLELPPNLPEIIVDERRIRQALINLLNNAVKFTPEGGTIKIVVEVETSSPSEFLLLSVIDSGIGIDPNHINKLFQPFVQIDSSLSRQHGGTGLGLALVQQLISLHQGTVRVQSEIGRGSCFTLCLPYLTKTVTIVPSETPLKPSFNLLPESDLLIGIESIARYLQELELHPKIYHTLEELMGEIQPNQSQFILLDLQSSEVSDWEIFQQLTSHPTTASIPIIILSPIDEKPQEVNLGKSKSLVKPISRHRFTETLEKLENRNFSSQLVPIILSNSAEIQSPLPLILLAEDNDVNITAISNYLLAYHYRLILANNGQDAVRLALSEHPDLILMDISMPGMDGLKAMKIIRSNPQFSQTPIIALTALAMSSDREKCLNAGATDYITKPVQLKFLVTRIQELLRKNGSSAL